MHSAVRVAHALDDIQGKRGWQPSFVAVDCREAHCSQKGDSGGAVLLYAVTLKQKRTFRDWTNIHQDFHDLTLCGISCQIAAVLVLKAAALVWKATIQVSSVTSDEPTISFALLATHY
jgi:hypothetical protein